MKSLAKATFIAFNYNEYIQVNSSENQDDQFLGILTYEKWCDMFWFELLFLYNKLLQALDFNIEVVYPIDSISKAIDD